MEASLADSLVLQAVSDCATEHYSGDEGRLRLALLRGECASCVSVSQALRWQLSDHLRRALPGIKAIYEYHPPLESDEALLDRRPDSSIRLALWMEATEPAQIAMASRIETALAESRKQLGCPNVDEDCFILEIHFMDDTDIRQRRGLAGLLSNQNLMIPIWQRGEPLMEVTAREPDANLSVSLPESLDPDLIPEEKLIEYALEIENLPAREREPLEHHLIQLKVTLIRRLISDHLDYIDVAKRWLTVRDLADILQHRIGVGRIGGKSAGMLLAGRILDSLEDSEIRSHVRVPESYFVGSDLMAIFMSMNGLTHWTDQKYKPEKEIRDEYSLIQGEFAAGEFPPEILEEFRGMLAAMGTCPLIVRSSSQLEDSLGTSFAGKYDSHFCPNQGTPEANLRALTRAIARTYASTFKPDPLLYRRSKGVQDYDERMAVLIQQVQGEQWGNYYFPFAAGVAFSRNFYRWSPRIRREDGFMRLVWGLGTRAVERVGNDYPRIIALSHPTLHPDDSPDAIRRYSQQFVDVIDMQANDLISRPVHDVLTHDYPQLRYLVELAEGDYLRSPMGLIGPDQVRKSIVTFDGLLRRTPAASMMTLLLENLEDHYGLPVDVEFTLGVGRGPKGIPSIDLTLLQCRPLSQMSTSLPVDIPDDLLDEDVIFETTYMVPQGRLDDIRHVLFVEPQAYRELRTPSARSAVTSAISKINAELSSNSFICVGPGRWGSTNPDLGVSVDYSDICNAGALIELSGDGIAATPDASLGTHFFQDLMEAEIYPLAVPVDDQGCSFCRAFFYGASNALTSGDGIDPAVESTLRLLDVAEYRPGHHIELVMDSDHSRAVAFLALDRASDEPSRFDRE